MIDNTSVNYDIPAQAIISKCKGTGIYFNVNGESLEVFGKRKAIAEWKPIIAKHKLSIISELTRQPDIVDVQNNNQVLNIQPVMPVINWCELSEMQAIIELCTRLNIGLRVNEKNKLLEKGNIAAIPKYVSDLIDRYRGAVIAHLLGLPKPVVSNEQDSLNIAANCQSLDVTITEYCAAVGHSAEYREKLLNVRRRMAPVYLVQNLCAFRAWLYVAKCSESGRRQ